MDIKNKLLHNIKEKPLGNRFIFKGVFYHYEDSYSPIKLYFSLDDLDNTIEPRQLNYDHISLITETIDLQDLIVFVEKLGDNSIVDMKSYHLRLENGYFVDPSRNNQKFHTSLTDYERILLKEHRSYPQSVFRSKPSNLFLFKYQPMAEIHSNFYTKHYDPLPNKNNLPAFPDTISAIDHFLGKEFLRLSDWSLLFSVPISQSKIKKISYDKNKFIIDFQLENKSNKSFKCKYFLGYENLPSEVGELLIEEKNEVPFHDKVRRFYLLIFDIDEPEKIIDYRDYNLDDPFSNASEIEFAYNEENIEFIISNGEDSRTEFKLKIDKSDSKELLETFCSFANTDGGIIVIGVDDAGNAMGLTLNEIDSYRNKITDSVRYWIEPQVDYELKLVTYHEKQLLLAKIKKGINPPYYYKENGCYLRIADRDRLASRDEIISFTQRFSFYK